MKDSLRPWKVKAFVPYLKSGDSIYESACGSGLNLLLTLEVLLENNITSITVSGNDYLEKSIYRANQIWGSKGHCALETLPISHLFLLLRLTSYTLDISTHFWIRSICSLSMLLRKSKGAQVWKGVILSSHRRRIYQCKSGKLKKIGPLLGY